MKKPRKVYVEGDVVEQVFTIARAITGEDEEDVPPGVDTSEPQDDSPESEQDEGPG